jgi:hypothetical protein
MNAVEGLTDPMQVPVNIGGCEGMMGAVSDPFVQE